MLSGRPFRQSFLALLVVAMLAAACGTELAVETDRSGGSAGAGVEEPTGVDPTDEPSTLAGEPGAGLGEFSGTINDPSDFLAHEFSVEEGNLYSAVGTDGTDESPCRQNIYVGVAGPADYFDDRSQQDEFPDGEFLSDFDSATQNDTNWFFENVEGGQPDSFDLIVGEAQCANQPIEFIAEQTTTMTYLISVYNVPSTDWTLAIEDLGPQ